MCGNADENVKALKTFLTEYAETNSIFYIEKYTLELELKQYWIARSNRLIIKSEKINSSKI